MRLGRIENDSFDETMMHVEMFLMGIDLNRSSMFAFDLTLSIDFLL